MSTGADIYYLGQVEVRIEPGPVDTPCHVWQGHVDQKGYASAGRNRRRYRVHRDVYLSAYLIPDGFVVHHRCENKRCVNIDHLEAISMGDHVRTHRKGKPLIGGRNHG